MVPIYSLRPKPKNGVRNKIQERVLDSRIPQNDRGHTTTDDGRSLPSELEIAEPATADLSTDINNSQVSGRNENTASESRTVDATSSNESSRNNPEIRHSTRKKHKPSLFGDAIPWDLIKKRK